MQKLREREIVAAHVEGTEVTELAGMVVDVPIAMIKTGDLAFQYHLGSSVGDLRRSIAHEGQKEPIDLKGSEPYRIVDGFRRVQAI